MTRHIVLGLALLAALTGAAHADGLEPGQWKVTTVPEINGNAMPPQSNTRCLSPADTADLSKTFSPQNRSQNVVCERLTHEQTSTSLLWHYKCTGQPNMDVAGEFKFETPQRYTAMIISKVTAGDQTINSRVGIVGERVGDCP